MYVGRVSGTVVATVKHLSLNGRKLLWVDELDLAGEPNGRYDICVDTVQAGIGDKVLVLDEGTGARQVLKLSTAPIRAVIVGIVDDVALNETI